MNHLFTKLTSALLLILAVLAPAAIAQEAEHGKSIEERREEARIERLWNLNWRAFAPSFVEHNGEYVCVPSYERSKPSSVGKSTSQYRSETVWTQTYRDERGNETSRKLTKPEKDAFAAVAFLPEVVVGQYGYIRSGSIERIVDGKTVELEDVWLIDAEAVSEEKSVLKEKLWGKVLEGIEDAIRDRDRGRRGRSSRMTAENEALDWSFAAREEAVKRQRDAVFTRYTWVVKGYATDRLKEDARWPSAKAKGDGLQLVIVEVEGRTVTAVPAASLGKGITELQLIDYLQSRELTKAKFVEIVSDAKREHRNQYIEHALAKLTGNAVLATSEDGVNNEVELVD